MKKIILLFSILIVFIGRLESQTVTVTSPNGSECWLNGTSKTITWTDSGLLLVNIYYSTNSGSSWNSIYTMYTNTHSYNWNVPTNINSQNCRIKVSDYINTNVYDISNSDFSIMSAVTSINLSSPLNGYTVARPVGLYWLLNTYATSYNVQVSLNSSFSTTVIDAIVTGSNYTANNLNAGTLYYWRVKASNCASYLWSAVWSFTTQPAAPNPPNLISPANSASNVPVPVAFSWQASTGATSYNLQISTSSSFVPSTTYPNITTTTYSWQGDNSTTYYWRVSATNGGGTSGWSNAWYFTTAGAFVPQPPSLSLPSDNAIYDPYQSINFSWNSSTGANSYNIQFANNTAFSPTIIDQNLSSTNLTFSLNPSHQNKFYYWRVRAGVNNSQWSSFSSTRTLYVQDKYEPNNSMASPNDFGFAHVLNQDFDITIDAAIYPSSDLDFYKVLYSYTGYYNTVEIWMTDLPADYDLHLIRDPDLFGSPYNFHSTNGGTSPEHIGPQQLPYGAGFGNYFLVYVNGKNNNNPTSTYKLRLKLSKGSPNSINQISNVIPSELMLFENFPNPFNPITKIKFDIPKTSEVVIKIYDMLGKEIETLVDKELTTGTYEINWNAVQYPSGVYFYKMETKEFSDTKRMILIK